MGDGVSHQMDQRIGHQLHDRGVHLDGLGPDLEHDALAAAREPSRTMRTNGAKRRPTGTMRARVICRAARR